MPHPTTTDYPTTETPRVPVDGDPRIPDRDIAVRLARVERVVEDVASILTEFRAAMDVWLKSRALERAIEAAEDAEDARPGEAGIKAGPDGLGVAR